MTLWIQIHDDTTNPDEDRSEVVEFEDRARFVAAVRAIHREASK